MADMRRKFVTGPVLELPFYRMNVQFDPGKIDVLDDIGNVYVTMRISDTWGVLTVTQGGLITKNWRMAVVPAPADPSGTDITGDGYTLELNEGWVLEKLEEREGWRVIEGESTVPS